MRPTVRSVIVRRDDNLGDIVITLPVLNALRANYPDATLTLMVKGYQRALCENITDSFLDPVPLDQFPSIAKKYDLAFNIDYFGPANRARQVLRYGEINHINAVPGSRRYPIVRHLLNGLPAFGMKVPHVPAPQFTISSAMKKEVTQWLRMEDIPKKDCLWIGIHPGSRISQKRWPVEKFIRLSMWLVRSFGARLFFFGTIGEEDMIRSIEARLPVGQIRSILGEPLDFVAGVLARMDFFIGNDSGVGHLAAAVRTPTVSIFGPSSPVYWRPSGKKSIIVYKQSRNKKHKHGPALNLEDVKQGVLLCIQKHVSREKFAVLDYLRLSRGITISRSTKGVVVQAGSRGPACLVTGGWKRVKQILDAVRTLHSYQETLGRFPDAGPLLDLFILHGIIRQGLPAPANRSMLSRC